MRTSLPGLGGRHARDHHAKSSDRLGKLAMPFVIADPCIGVKDGSCVASCPVDCIYEAASQYYIIANECIDCGLCVPTCPVEAIFDESTLPTIWSDAFERNKQLAEFTSGVT